MFPSCLGQLEPVAEAGTVEWGDAQPQGLVVGQSSNRLVFFKLEKDLIAAGSM